MKRIIHELLWVIGLRLAPRKPLSGKPVCLACYDTGLLYKDCACDECRYGLHLWGTSGNRPENNEVRMSPRNAAWILRTISPDYLEGE